jgi:uncharacterized protein YuzE
MTDKKNLEKVDSIEVKNGQVSVYYTDKMGKKQFMKTGDGGFIAMIEAHQEAGRLEMIRIQNMTKKK